MHTRAGACARVPFLPLKPLVFLQEIQPAGEQLELPVRIFATRWQHCSEMCSRPARSVARCPSVFLGVMTLESWRESRGPLRSTHGFKYDPP